MKALFKHLSAITQGEPGSVANNTSPLSNNISTPFLSTTLLAVLLGVPQVPLIGSGKVVAQTAPTCPAGTVPETVQFQANDSLQDLTQQFNIGGIDTVLTLSEEVPGQVIDRIESRFDGGVYGGLPGPNLRLNIGPGKPNRADQPGGTGNLAPGSATLTINFAQPVTLASPLTLLDVDQEGARDNNRFFRDRVAVSASNNNSNVPVNLQAIGNFTQVSGNTAFGQIENSLPDQNQGNVSITPQGPVDQISILYTPDTSEPRGQDQTIGLAPFTICAGSPAVGSIGDTVYRDNNNNSVQDQGDVGIPNVPVTLTLPGPDGQLGTQDDTTQNTTTNEQGIYTFPNLPAGNYQVTVQNPDGLTPTQTQPNPVDLQQGQNRDDVDFGFAPGQTGSIGDTVYRDDNGDGTQNEGEPGIPNVEVTLINPGPDGQFGTPDDTTQTTTTDDTGNYGFPNVPPGNYQVVVNNPPDGLTPTQVPPQTVTVQPGEDFEDADFGFSPQQTGSIGDTVYTDTNSNNVQDDGEQGIPGATVNLTLPGPDGQLGTQDDTTQTTTTDDNGIYTFSNLPAGNYRVTATSPRQEDTATQTQPDNIELQPGQNRDDVDFGFVPSRVGQGPGTIGDTVYNDTNRNNQQDEGETGIPGVTVTLATPGEDGQLGTEDDVTTTTTTNEQGIYGFSNLPAGNYRVTINNPDGLTPTQTPPETITLADNQTNNDVDFGLAPGQQQGTGSLGDTVYRDVNGNGEQDPDEPGIPGVVVNYAGTGPDGVFGESLDDDDTSGRTQTDENGRYTFPNLPAGTYRVTINDPSQQPIRGLTGTQTPNNPIDLDEGENFEDADFGFTEQTGTIGDTVYRDENSDGTQNEGESGIPNVEVTLVNPGPDGQFGNGDDTTQTTTTNDQGIYSFPNVPTGNYQVVVNNPPEGLNPTQTPPSNIPLQPGQTFNDADFGFSPQQVGTIGDFVFFDNDGDSTPDNDESGIPNITLVLRDGDGNEIQTTTTDEDGFYNFVAPPGTYTVTVGNPPQGLNPTLTQDNPVNLEAGQNIDTVDFGFQPPLNGSIGDTVFADENGNGTQDPGEPGVSGVVIRLVRPGEDGVFGTPDDQIEEQTTDNTDTVAFNENTPGQYTFDNLPPGDYQVQMVLPDGSILTTGSNPISVDLQPGQNLDSADFGIRMTGFGGDSGSIGDEVFNDTDGDGVRDEGEPGVPNVPVTLTLPGPDGQLDTSDDTTQTTNTNDQGIYTFDNLPPGPYRVSVTPPLNLPEVTNPGGSQIERDLQPGQNLDNVDFGLRGPDGGSIGDTVFNDRNGDGVQDFTDTNNNGVKDANEEGEAGIPGVQLTLRDSDGNIVATTTTNDNGNYIFNGLPLANYTVEAARPTDFSPTTETTLSAQLTEDNPSTNEVDFGFRPGRLGASGPANLRLVKRITNIIRGNASISGVTFNQFEDDPNDDDDNVIGESQVAGITRLETPVQSGDIVEYTIYFQSEGGEALQNVRVCDLIPDGTTFDSIVEVSGGGTGADSGNFLTPLTPVPAEFQNICANGTPTNGAVITNLGTLPAGGQFGFVRFRVRIN